MVFGLKPNPFHIKTRRSLKCFVEQSLYFQTRIQQIEVSYSMYWFKSQPLFVPHAWEWVGPKAVLKLAGCSTEH